MSFWRRSTLLVFYLFLIVISSWILEWFLLWETGFATYQIVEPLQDLSVAQLQAILDKRGISYDGLIEKREIVESLKQSGSIQYMELLAALSPSNSKGAIDITCREEYYEQLSEESESVWLLEVIPDDSSGRGNHILPQASSDTLQKSLEPLGIYMGRVHCRKDPWLCEEQGWLRPQLVLVVPKTHLHRNVKASLFCSGNEQLMARQVFNWLIRELSHLTERIHSVEELETVALNKTLSQEKQISHMVFVSELLSPPLLLMTLGLRFSSRIKFSFFSVGKSDKEQVLKLLKKHKLNGPPCLVFTSPRSVTSYGSKKGEMFSLRSLETYVKFIQPKGNDIFLVSLLTANLLALLEIFDSRSSFWKHLVRSLCNFPMYNIAIFILWLILTSVVKFPWMSPFVDLGLYLAQKLAAIHNGSFFIYYLTIVEYFVGLNLLVFATFGVAMFCWRKYSGCSSENFPQDDSWYTVFPMDSYIVNVLFRPMASLSRPRPPYDLGLEEGMELLIERLATPDLWLHPVVPTDYIKNLPVWRYDGWGNEDDLKSESETDWDSLSETESDMMLQNHTCCQDEACKMCVLWTTVKETYVCHRCAILKRKLEKQYLKSKNAGESANYNATYERLIKVCENCLRTRRNNGPHPSLRETGKKTSAGRNLYSPLFSNLKWTAPGYAIESRVCAICLDKYRWSAVLCGLPCGHTYHHACISEWLSKDNHHCPSCRWPSYKFKVFSNFNKSSTLNG